MCIIYSTVLTCYYAHFTSKHLSLVRRWFLLVNNKQLLITRRMFVIETCSEQREALFPGLDLDSGLDWTLDWTHRLWLNSALEHSLKPD